MVLLLKDLNYLNFPIPSLQVVDEHQICLTIPFFENAYNLSCTPLILLEIRNWSILIKP